MAVASRRKVLVGILLAGAAVGMLGAFGLGRQTTRIGRDERIASESASEWRSNDDLVRLESALAKTQEQIGRLEAKQLDRDRPPAPSPSEPVPPRAATSEELENQFIARSRSAQTERRDEAWAKTQEERIRALAKTAAPSGRGYTLESLSCHASICTMQVAFPSREDASAFGYLLPNELSEEVAGSHFGTLSQHPDGTYHEEVLVFRRGYPMPGLRDGM
jgi:hypothetical protein